MNDRVEVISYQDTWPLLFEKEANTIKQALGENCITIYHIGSTAVAGLSAKPVIDILPVVKNIVEVEKAVSAMQKNGYVSKREHGMLFRHFFQKSVGKKAFNVHVYEQDSDEIERYLTFRDWMRTHSDDRLAYQNLKITLAKRFPDDILSYCLGKDAFVAAIDKKTGFKGLRIVHALSEREWASARYLGNFNEIAKNNDHHLVLYKGSEIMGYANIGYLATDKAILEILKIDKSHDNFEIKDQFLKMLEQWLTSQKVKAIYVPILPETKDFYAKRGYQEMRVEDDPLLGKILT